MWLHCNSCGQDFQVPGNCGKRSCFICRQIQFKRLFRRYIGWLSSRSNLRMMTLTRVNVGVLCKDYIAETRSYFSKLIRRKYYDHRISGGLYALECTNKGRGWHLHIHCIYEGKFVSHKLLSADWLDITNDSNYVWISTVDNVPGALDYLLKDLLKTPQIGNNEEDYDFAFKGVRFVSVFGNWYNNIPPVKNRTRCKFCGEDDVMSWYKINEEAMRMKNQYEEDVFVK